MFISLATPTILEFTVYTDIAWYGYTLLVTDYALGLLFCWVDLQMVEDLCSCWSIIRVALLY